MISFKNSEKLEKLKFVCFEGPDCCGKSTQVDKFIEMSLSETGEIQRPDVILKFHFPFNTSNDDKLKMNYENLVNTIYSKSFFEKGLDANKKDKLESVLTDNVKLNSYDKCDFMHVLYILLDPCDNIELDMKINCPSGTKISILDILLNKNCEIYFKGECLNKSDTNKLVALYEYFINTDKPNTLLIFDRFIISGMVYNYHLPYMVIQEMIKDKIISNESDIRRFKYLFSYLRNRQLDYTHRELKGFNGLNTNILNYDNSECCDPNVIWNVFKESKEIYKAFLNDKTRKVEEYDTNDLIRSSVNKIYEDIATNGNNSSFLLDCVFNMRVVDSDSAIVKYGSDNAKNCISKSIYRDYIINYSDINSISNRINDYLKSINYTHIHD